jgi:hypothetical protein
MQLAFDLISDLHVETWTDDFDWAGQATSAYCVVAGDVCRDRDRLVPVLDNLAQNYPGGVFYIDGNDEHRNHLEDLGDSYSKLDHLIRPINNLVYLQDNVVIINGVAFLGSNGWWNFNFDSTGDAEQAQDWYQQRLGLSKQATANIVSCAYSDAAYLVNSIKKLQTHKEVHAIVMISHTVPLPDLIAHDPELVHTHRFNCIGNNLLLQALEADSENKIHTWCFGHYHNSVDQIHENIRWVNNCRGRGDSPWRQHTYFPKRIEINF